MYKKIIIVVLIILILVVGIFYFKNTRNSDQPDLMEMAMVQEYLRENIKTIAPDEPVLGGSWYLVSAKVNLDENTAEVIYEDGHIQNSASLSYDFDPNSGEVKILEAENINKEEKTSETPIVGGDKDEHGCIGSAGYSWCEVKNKCLRIWEEPCEVEADNLGSGNSEQGNCLKNGGVWYPDENLCEINSLSEEECVAKGGEFNECASACRHEPEAVACTMQCVLTCTFR